MANRTRWYKSLSIRLLVLFWMLFFAVASSGYLLALWFSKPILPEPLPIEVQSTLEPLLSDDATFRSLTPGRLLAGNYRVAASVGASGPERLQLDRLLASSHQRVLMQQLEASEPEQVPINDRMLIGPFSLNAYKVLLTRPLTDEERVQQVVSEQRAQEAQTTALFVGSMVIAIVLGIWLVRPLRILTMATRQIAKGSDAPLVLKQLPRRTDELGELARALHTTAHDLTVSRDAQRRLLSDVSHELRSPLARLQVALMLTQDDDAGDNPHLQQMHRDVERLSAIIERILSLSRLENGLVKLTPVELNTRELVEQLVADLRYVDIALGDRVKILPDDGEHGDWPVIGSDSELLRLVIENLVRNALQYTDNEVHLSCELAGSSFHIRIRDFGDGVPEQQLKQLFEPFFRGDPARHHKAGVGLGMALSLRAATVLGGSVSARNHPDGGLEASISLPLQGS
jgi:two-component system OmpR family sensor kinase